jgi:hypothetical protein
VFVVLRGSELGALCFERHGVEIRLVELADPVRVVVIRKVGHGGVLSRIAAGVGVSMMSGSRCQLRIRSLEST